LQPQNYTDETLYEGLRNNHQPAFEHLYRQHFPAVRQLVYQHRGSEDDAKDIFQEGMIALWNNIRSGAYQLREGAKMSTYLIQICKLRWMDRLKKASTRYEMKQDNLGKPEADTLPEPSEGGNVVDHWIAQEEMQQFSLDFAQLGERCQDLLKRFYFAKESLQQIATAFGMGEASAKNEKYRCMQRLKKIVLKKN